MRHTAALLATIVLLGAPASFTQNPGPTTGGIGARLEPTGGRGLTEVHGIKVGRITMSERPTGCTVVLVDGEGVPAACRSAAARPAPAKPICSTR